VCNGVSIYLSMPKLPYNPNLKEKARNLRKAGNLAEVLLWNRLKNKQMAGCDFTRQQIIGNYIVDFYCPKLRLAIEVDGISHNFKGKYDEERDKYLKACGVEVLHISDTDVKTRLNQITENIYEQIRHKLNTANK